MYTSKSMSALTLRTLGSWYERNERRLSSLSLVTGFLFDILFVQKIDIAWQSVWIASNITLAVLCIVIINWKRSALPQVLSIEKNKFHFWMLSILQFLLGGMLGTLFLFYLKGAVLGASWPFFLVLLIGVIGNEFLKKQYTRVSLQIGFIFFSIFLLLTYLVPYIVGTISPTLFVISGVLSVLVIVGIYFIITLRIAKAEKVSIKKTVRIVVACIYTGMNILYFSGAIPPLPLLLHDSGVFHAIQRNENGTYTATVEPAPSDFLSRLGVYTKKPVFTYDGNPAYVYSAIGSPTSFTISIVHQWQYKNPTSKKWETRAEISVPVSGGRNGGYRTYSLVRSLAEGKWRVNVQTPSGQTIGRIRFHVQQPSSPLSLETITLP